MFTSTIGPLSLLREDFSSVETACSFIGRRCPENWAIVPAADGMVSVTSETHAKARGEQILASASLVEKAFKVWFKRYKQAIIAVDPRYTASMLRDRSTRAWAWMHFNNGQTPQESVGTYARMAA